MSFSLMASTGTVLNVWRRGEVFYAERPEPAPAFVRACQPVALSGVIAELAGLDLEIGDEAWEADRLADAMRQRFVAADADDDNFSA